MLKAGIGIEKDEETTEEQYMYSCFWKLQINMSFLVLITLTGTLSQPSIVYAWLCSIF